MEFLIREIGPNEYESETTQGDQFNTDLVGLAEALVREAHQNSIDEPVNPGGVVRTRIALHVATGEAADYWCGLLAAARPHAVASGFDMRVLDEQEVRVLVIEDFGTTGLLGAIDSKDNGNFSDFWRRSGRSHKSGRQGGRWGLGKLVYWSASRARTFFGLTVRSDDPSRTSWLMGQTVFRHHEIGSPPRAFVPQGFFALSGPREIQRPSDLPEDLAAFRNSSGASRTDEPGLSIAIPFLHEEITIEALVPHVVRNWFIPILGGRLVVEIGDVTLTADSLSAIAATHGGPEFADGVRLSFVSAVHDAHRSAHIVPLASDWANSTQRLFADDGTLAQLRERYESGELVSARAPITLRRKSGEVLQTHVDLFLQRAQNVPGGEAFFVRGGMSVPIEARRARRRACLSAMIADEPAVEEFLGDAETPAHTSWQGTAEKVRANWQNPQQRLREVRDALSRFTDVVAVPGDRMDEGALAHVFGIPRGGTQSSAPRAKPLLRRPPVPPITRKPARYRLEQRTGGFSVNGVRESQLPLRIQLRMAYSVIDGNPLRQYSPHDFELGNGGLDIECSGAAFEIAGPNTLVVDALQADFRLSITGFDSNRDLFVLDSEQ